MSVDGRFRQDAAAADHPAAAAPADRYLVVRSLRDVIPGDKLAAADVPVGTGGVRPGRVPARRYRRPALTLDARIRRRDGRAKGSSLDGPADEPPVPVGVLHAEQLALQPVALLGQPRQVLGRGHLLLRLARSRFLLPLRILDDWLLLALGFLLLAPRAGRQLSARSLRPKRRVHVVFLVRIDQHLPTVHVVLEEHFLAPLRGHLAIGHDPRQRRDVVRGARGEGVEGLGVVVLKPRPGDVLTLQEIAPGLFAHRRLVLLLDHLAVLALSLGEFVLGNLLSSSPGLLLPAHALEPAHPRADSVEGFDRRASAADRGQAPGRDTQSGSVFLPGGLFRLLFPVKLQLRVG